MAARLCTHELPAVCATGRESLDDDIALGDELVHFAVPVR